MMYADEEVLIRAFLEWLTGDHRYIVMRFSDSYHHGEFAQVDAILADYEKSDR